MHSPVISDLLSYRTVLSIRVPYPRDIFCNSRIPMWVFRCSKTGICQWPSSVNRCQLTHLHAHVWCPREWPSSEVKSKVGKQLLWRFWNLDLSEGSASWSQRRNDPGTGKSATSIWPWYRDWAIFGTRLTEVLHRWVFVIQAKRIGSSIDLWTQYIFDKATTKCYHAWGCSDCRQSYSKKLIIVIKIAQFYELRQYTSSGTYVYNSIYSFLENII